MTACDMKTKFVKMKADISSAITEKDLFLKVLNDQDFLTEAELKSFETRTEDSTIVAYDCLDSLQKKDIDYHEFFKCLNKTLFLKKYPKLSDIIPDSEKIETCIRSHRQSGSSTGQNTQIEGKSPQKSQQRIKPPPMFMLGSSTGQNTQIEGKSPQKCQQRIKPPPMFTLGSSAGQNTQIEGKSPQKCQQRIKPPPMFTFVQKQKERQFLREENKERFPVACGVKKGIFIRKRWKGASTSDKCIKSDGVLYTPTKFEEHGGRESSKNWQLSIRFMGLPLKNLFASRKLTPLPKGTRRNPKGNRRPSTSGEHN